MSAWASGNLAAKLKQKKIVDGSEVKAVTETACNDGPRAAQEPPTVSMKPADKSVNAAEPVEAPTDPLRPVEVPVATPSNPTEPVPPARKYVDFGAVSFSEDLVKYICDDFSFAAKPPASAPQPAPEPMAPVEEPPAPAPWPTAPAPAIDSWAPPNNSAIPRHHHRAPVSLYTSHAHSMEPPHHAYTSRPGFGDIPRNYAMRRHVPSYPVMRHGGQPETGSHTLNANAVPFHPGMNSGAYLGAPLHNTGGFLQPFPPYYPPRPHH